MLRRICATDGGLLFNGGGLLLYLQMYCWQGKISGPSVT
jgi:hypothetical protein